MDGTKGFSLNGGGRVYFATKPADDFSDPNMYWQVTSFFPLTYSYLHPFSYITKQVSPSNFTLKNIQNINNFKQI